MKVLLPILAAITVPTVVSAGNTISVLGAGVFPVPVGGAPCSGSDTKIAGACPAAQAGLAFGSCCVSIPGRATTVMGCAPLLSASDSCEQVGQRLKDQASAANTATTTSIPTTQPDRTLSPTNPVTTESPATPTVTPIATPLPSTSNIEQTTAQPKDTTAPSATTTEVPTTTTPAPTSDEPTTVPSTTEKTNALQQAPMTDIQSSTSIAKEASDNANSVLVGVSIVGVAVAIIGGVLFVRKQKPSDNAATPSTPPQPASMVGPVAYAEETPCNDDDFLTPKEDLVCL